MTNRKTNGYVIYEGPSLIDGQPIVAIAVKSRNKKTGVSLQTFILRQDVNPLEANKAGLDYSICGDCPLRGEATSDPNRKTAKNRACYVTLMHAPLVVYKQYKAGKYPKITGHEALADLGASFDLVRLGAYGDPSAIPSYLHESLINKAKAHTAYSHQANHDKADYNGDIYMRSADSLDDAKKAWSIGDRTFRLVKSLSEIIKGKEILCPASKEAGEKVTCADCRLCGGASVKAKSIAIVAHGNGAKYA